MSHLSDVRKAPAENFVYMQILIFLSKAKVAYGKSLNQERQCMPVTPVLRDKDRMVATNWWQVVLLSDFMTCLYYSKTYLKTKQESYPRLIVTEFLIALTLL